MFEVISMFRIVISILIAMFIAIPTQQTAAGYRLFSSENRLHYFNAVDPMCDALKSRYGMTSFQEMGSTPDYSNIFVALLGNGNDCIQFWMHGDYLAFAGITCRNQSTANDIMWMFFNNLGISPSEYQNRTPTSKGFSLWANSLNIRVDVETSYDKDGSFGIIIDLENEEQRRMNDAAEKLRRELNAVESDGESKYNGLG